MNPLSPNYNLKRRLPLADGFFAVNWRIRGQHETWREQRSNAFAADRRLHLLLAFLAETGATLCMRTYLLNFQLKSGQSGPVAVIVIFKMTGVNGSFRSPIDSIGSYLIRSKINEPWYEWRREK
ncbi:hypothetical protein [Paenibacillus elgii]|uniref:hypothetical protein n=1 Tax=Paenibacillus elgii TaxID=189691 RepID=UPI00203B8A06|nr:hypothetical protein [Paenibacillus elgii]MCM3271235.1 hypothetical protein [Paenibacillus elgii]